MLSEFDSGQGSDASSCEHGNEFSGSIKRWRMSHLTIDEGFCLMEVGR
jgi:hypothetical protein